MTQDRWNRRELLKDSEATLREVAGILLELWDNQSPASEAPAHPDPAKGNGKARHLLDLVGLLMATYREIRAVLERIREGRHLLQQAAVERVRRTHEKLAEVTATTELAATDMLDGLERALALLDRLVPREDVGPGQEPDTASLVEELREELHRLVILLQFQDITAQQLAYAAGVLSEVEERLDCLSKVFDLQQLESPEWGAGGAQGSGSGFSFDPGASSLNAEERQALADRIFTGAGKGGEA